MYNFFIMIEKFGPSVALFIFFSGISIKVVIWLNKLDSKIKRHSHIMEEIKSDVDKIHSGCHIPIGSVKKLEDEVNKLKLQDAVLDGDIKKIDEHLTSLDNSMDEIKTDVKSVLNYLIKKGIDG